MFHEILKDIMPIIDVSAPLLAKTLRFPGFSEITELALNILTKSFGLSTDDIMKLPETVLNDNDAHNKLSSIDNDFSNKIMSVKKTLRVSHAEINIKLDFQGDKDEQGMPNVQETQMQQT